MFQKHLEWTRFGVSTVFTCVAIAFLAQGATGANQNSESSGQVCEDLYSVACAKSEIEKESQEKRAAEKLVSDARDAGAKSLGYADFFDGLSKELFKQGLTLAKPVDEKTKSQILEDGFLVDNLKGLQSGQHCQQEQQQLRNETPNPATESTAEAFVAKARNLIEGQRTLSIKYFALDLPSFMNKLASDCKVSREQGGGPGDVDFEKTKASCDNLNDVKRQAALLSRESIDEPAGRAKVEAFIAAHLSKEDLNFAASTPIEDEFADGFKSTAKVRTETSAAKPESIFAKSPWDERVRSATARLSTACADPNTAASAAVARIYADFATRVNRSPETIEALARTVYSSGRRQKIEGMLKEAQGDLNDVLSQVVSDSSKRAKIQSGYDTLRLDWMEKPDASLYTPGKDGKLSLDSEKYQRAIMQSGRASSLDIDELTADPTLSGFKTKNAFYNPAQSGPAIKYDETISIGPGFLPLADSNPEALRTLLGHELAHRIGSFRGLANGFDLKAEYAPLLACYADSKSIKMQPSERDEVISDYIASEVLARRVSRLPAAERRTAVIRAMAPLCAEADGFETSEGPRSVHPREEFRVSGIFGASPNLRLSLGCAGDARDFKSCGLPNKMTPLSAGSAGTTSAKESLPASSGNGSAQ